MTVEVFMPKWGDTMQEGILIEWSVAVGDHVTEGDSLATVETEKVEADLEATVSGEVVELLVEEGDEVPVGARVARIRT